MVFPVPHSEEALDLLVCPQLVSPLLLHFFEVINEYVTLQPHIGVNGRARVCKSVPPVIFPGKSPAPS